MVAQRKAKPAQPPRPPPPAPCAGWRLQWPDARHGRLLLLAGDVAEWLRSGLQSRLHRFDSGRRLCRKGLLRGAFGLSRLLRGEPPGSARFPWAPHSPRRIETTFAPSSPAGPPQKTGELLRRVGIG